MKLLEIPWEPSSRQLRQFGGIATCALPLIVWWWGGSVVWILAAALIGGGLFAVSWWQPRLVRPVFVGLCLLALPIGLVVGWLALFLIYFLLFLPMGMLFRLIGRDRLQRRLERSQASYWEAKRQAKDLGSYYRQS